MHINPEQRDAPQSYLITDQDTLHEQETIHAKQLSVIIIDTCASHLRNTVRNQGQVTEELAISIVHTTLYNTSTANTKFKRTQ